MVTVILSWFAFFTLIVSAGCLAMLALSRLTKVTVGQDVCIFQAFWFGLAVVIALAQLWSLFFPLNGVSLILLISLSLLGLPSLATLVRTRVTASLPRRAGDWARLALLVGCGIAAVAVGAMGVATFSWGGEYDTDLYHFSWIRWANEYPAVPGLANLHSRLGTPSGFLLFSALIDNMWWDRSSAWLTNGFLITLSCLHWLSMILSRSRDIPLRARMFSLLTFPYLLKLLVEVRPTLYYDKPALLLQLLLVAELLRFQPLLSQKGRVKEHDLVTPVLVLLTLTTLSFSFKPIGAMSLLLMVVLSAFILLPAALSGRSGARVVAAAFSVSCFLLIGHLARNAILSGWLLYPAPLGKLNVDWAMPKNPLGDGHWHEMQSVAGQYKVIKAWARVPGAEYTRAITEGPSFWFPRWRRRVWVGKEPGLLYTGAIIIAVYLLIAAATRMNRRFVGFDGFLVCLAGSNLLYWFVSAPDMRFGDAFFWLWFSLAVCIFLSLDRLPSTVGLILCAVAFGYLLQLQPLHLGTNSGPALWGVGKAEPKPTETIVLSNGQVPPLTLRVPKEGDQCGDAELPCTPYPLNTLKQRKPGHLRFGFLVGETSKSSASVWSVDGTAQSSDR